MLCLTVCSDCLHLAPRSLFIATPNQLRVLLAYQLCLDKDKDIDKEGLSLLSALVNFIA